MNENVMNSNDYLSHHGIDGMRWGKRNGPPYPLSRADHNKVVSGESSKPKRTTNTKRDPKTGKFIKGKSKKVKVDKPLTDRQKSKILKNPKKIVKYQEKLTREEIEDALQKLYSVEKVKSQIKKRKLFSRRDSGLTRRQRRMAKNPTTLQRNMHKFSPEDLQKAINYLNDKNKLFDMKIRNADKPRKVTEKVSDYTYTTATLLNNVANLKSAATRFKTRGLTPDEERKKWLYLNDPLAYRVNNPEAANKLMALEQILERKGKKMTELSQDGINDKENYIAHYGVKGMRWRNHVYVNKEDLRQKRLFNKKHERDTEEIARSEYQREEEKQKTANEISRKRHKTLSQLHDIEYDPKNVIKRLKRRMGHTSGRKIREEWEAQRERNIESRDTRLNERRRRREAHRAFRSEMDKRRSEREEAISDKRRRYHSDRVRKSNERRRK